MNRKFAAIVLSFTMLFATTFSAGAAEAPPDANQRFADISDDAFAEDKLALDRKVYCDMTLEDDFDDHTVLVVLSKEKSREKDIFTQKDFPEIDCAEVVDLSVGTKKLIASQQRAMQKIGTTARELTERSLADANWEKTRKTLPDELLDCDGGALYLAEPELFRRILSIKLKEPGKENVLKAVKLLEKREDVIGASPDRYISLCAV